MCGHYGSGKTNLAISLALELKKKYASAVLVDMDIVNPYFRAHDSALMLKEAGIRLICSPYANSNLDIPSLPQELYAVTDDMTGRFVLDIGGDDRGAYALGRLSKAILAENDYAMLAVLNRYRPLTRTAKETLTVLREIEAASGIPFTAIVNNSNLGIETTTETVLDSLAYAQEVSHLSGLPIIATAVKETLIKGLSGLIPDLFPIKSL